MALLKCKECKNKISSEAESCPKCGTPNPFEFVSCKNKKCGQKIMKGTNKCPYCYKKQAGLGTFTKVVLGLFAIVIVMNVINSGRSKSDDNKAQAEPESTEVTQVQPVAESEIVKTESVGESASSEEVEVTEMVVEATPPETRTAMNISVADFAEKINQKLIDRAIGSFSLNDLDFSPTQFNPSYQLATSQLSQFVGVIITKDEKNEIISLTFPMSGDGSTESGAKIMLTLLSIIEVLSPNLGEEGSANMALEIIDKITTNNEEFKKTIDEKIYHATVIEGMGIFFAVSHKDDDKANN